MTDIEKKAYEAYPDFYGTCNSPYNRTPDLNKERREGYIKCAEEYESLTKVHGWIARDGTENEPSGLILHFLEKPWHVIDDSDAYWESRRDYDGEFIEIPESMEGEFKDISWNDEPVEVEFLIRRV